MTKPKRPAARPAAVAPPALGPGPAGTTHVEVRMYCMGTGDCFVLKFHAAEELQFTMMIDCGSCVGGASEFKPYVENLAEWVGAKKSEDKWSGGSVDLLVVTHEHNDHVNGFAKCLNIFEGINFKQAWFAWTENPADPDGKAQDLLKKRERMRTGFQQALKKVADSRSVIEKELPNDF